MIVCAHTDQKKHGKDRHGNQRFRCLLCGKTWVEKQNKPLGDMRIDMADAVTALKLLLEGMPIRGVERFTGLHRDTIVALVVQAGGQCARLLRARVRNIPAKEVQCDELWGFVGCKERTRQQLGHGQEFGDCYCFVAMEKHTKLVLTHHVDKRSSDATYAFIDNLNFATTGRFQISTDGWRPYQAAIPLLLGFDVDFAQIIKRFNGSSDTNPERKYSPANIISVEKTRGCGNPDLKTATTSHIERLNLSLRMGNRRLTRLTNGHSKKWENHEAMMALYFGFYNFCRPHQAIKSTPAMAQGLTDHQWTIEELLTESATHC